MLLMKLYIEPHEIARILALFGQNSQNLAILGDSI